LILTISDLGTIKKEKRRLPRWIVAAEKGSKFRWITIRTICFCLALMLKGETANGEVLETRETDDVIASGI